MGKDPIPSLLLRFILPAMAASIASALYNIIDRAFIGHCVGTAGLAAVSVVFPIVLTLLAFSSLAGTGTASQVSRYLGEGDAERAHAAFDTCVTASLIAVLSASAALWLWTDGVIALCGGSGQIASLTRVYLRILIPFMPAQFLSLVLMACLRAQGRPAPAMWGSVLGSLVNVALDWLFIVRMDMGIAGAAWGTAAAQAFCFVWVCVPFVRRTGELDFRSLRARIVVARLCEMCEVGASPFLVNMFFSVMMAIYNIQLKKYGGELALSAMGVFFGVDALLYMPITGLGEGSLPVMAYNYGAREYDRLKQAVRLSLLSSMAYFCCSLTVAEFCPEVLVAMFSRSDPELSALTAHFMRIGYCALPLGAVSMVAGYIFEALGKAGLAFKLIVARQILAYALLFVLPPLFGPDGVWYSLPAIDGLGGIVGGFMLAAQWKTWHD